MTAAAVDGPPLLKVTVPFTSEPALAEAGTLTLVVTSATGEMFVVLLALSGSALAPWDVVVEIWLVTVTEPLAGAMYCTPIVSVWPLVTLVGMPVNVTPPVALSYVAVTPPGSDGKLSVPSPGSRASV